MVIRVLIINRQLVFAVTIKQALEQTGAFEVHPFTDPNAAMEYLRTHPHDVALVDFAVKVMPGKKIVEGLRAIQPEIAVIASPMQADSNRVIRELRLQGMIDAPFSARGIIPLIEHAVEQMSQPLQAITRTFVEPDTPTVADTEVLSRPGPLDPSSHEGPAGTHALPEEDWTRAIDFDPENAPQTRILGDDAPDAPVHTHILDDEGNAPQTHILSGDAPGEDEPIYTRILGNAPEDAPQTRDLQYPDEPVHTRVLDDEEHAPHLPVAPAERETRILDDDFDEPLPTHDLRDRSGARPPRLPEFSSLDDVLADEEPSTLFEPPVRDGDTPSVPSVDSDAVRQFLATARDTGEFDRMLGDIAPEDNPEGPPQLPGGDFENLVNSMRAEQQYTPLPDRHQQFVEFILTGGMDTLLSEIEQHKTGMLDEGEVPPALPEKSKPKPKTTPKLTAPPDTFEKLAAEEPPRPTLEEGGTVSDLMVGVSDASFRNVLAMMRGEDVADVGSEEDAPSTSELDEAFSRFHEQAAKVEEAEEEAPPTLPESSLLPAPIPEFDDDDDDAGSITAQLILETALNESTPVDTFSLGSLIDNIERQLAEHKPDIQPLPSWNIVSMQSRQHGKAENEELPRSDAERYVREPDFLPEEFSEPLTDLPVAEVENELPEDEPENLWEIYQQAEQVKALRRTQELAAAAAQQEQEESEPEPEAVEEARTAIEPDWLLDDMEEEAAVTEASDDWYAGEPEAEETFEAEAGWSPDMLEIEAVEDDEGEWPEMDMQEITARLAGRVDAAIEHEEPSLLPDEYDEMDQATVVGEHAALPADLWDDLSSDWESDADWDSEPESEPIEEEVEPPALPEFEDDWELTIDEAPEDETVMLEHPHRAEELVTLGAGADFEPVPPEFEVAEPDDPYIAHIALSLTQVSLELAAEATLLTSEDEIVAIAGTLAQEDIEGLREVLADDWDANPNEARVRFVTLPSGNKDYMLYSRKTVNDFTLTMIFSGSMPLRDIRRQGRRLIEALENVPEVTPETPQEVMPNVATMTGEVPAVEMTPVEPEVVQPFTYLWLVRDPETSFADRTSRAIVAGLNLQLSELGWQLKSLRAQPEYVYVHANVPGERPAYQVIDDLKRRVAEIAHAQEPDLMIDSLWADSYLVMMPGRELAPDEIDQFIAFERMA